MSESDTVAEAKKLAASAEMNNIVARAKEYEYITVSYDPEYNNILASIEIVKDFIIKHDLVLYGGTGLDMALRLRGDKIYPDNEVPDLDFYSPNSVNHAYELADILYRAGFEGAAAIGARYVRTMRVDIGGGHFVADITYYPAELFAKLPTLKYNGMRIVHPLYQRIDMHNSLSHPYDNPPQEVIFDRWGKDIRRFNQMNEHYPVEVSEQTKLATVSLPAGLHKFVLSGWVAYAIIYWHYLDLMAAITGTGVISKDKNTDVVEDADIEDADIDDVDTEDVDTEDDIDAGQMEGAFSLANFIIGGKPAPRSKPKQVEATAAKAATTPLPILSRPSLKITNQTLAIEVPEQALAADGKHFLLDIVSLNPHKHIGRLAAAIGKVSKIVEYEPYVSMIPASFTAEIATQPTQKHNSLQARIVSSANKLVSVNVVKISGLNFKVANVQLLMKDLLAQHNTTGSAVYLAHYASLLSMIGEVERAMVGKTTDMALLEMIGRSPLFPSIYTYGNNNHSLSYQVLINKTRAELGEEKQQSLPWNYYPARSVPKGYAWPAWNYDSSPFFRESGKVIDASVNESAAAPAD